MADAMPGHNSVAADELRQFIERIEQMAQEKQALQGDISDAFAEAKGRGYDTKVMKKIIALRKRKADDVAEEDAILDIYKSALGM
jgi:uncharacterized protein (UPF0335 family)